MHYTLLTIVQNDIEMPPTYPYKILVIDSDNEDSYIDISDQFLTLPDTSAPTYTSSSDEWTTQRVKTSSHERSGKRKKKLRRVAKCKHAKRRSPDAEPDAPRCEAISAATSRHATNDACADGSDSRKPTHGVQRAPDTEAPSESADLPLSSHLGVIINTAEIDSDISFSIEPLDDKEREEIKESLGWRWSDEENIQDEDWKDHEESFEVGSDEWKYRTSLWDSSLSPPTPTDQNADEEDNAVVPTGQSSEVAARGGETNEASATIDLRALLNKERNMATRADGTKVVTMYEVRDGLTYYKPWRDKRTTCQDIDADADAAISKRVFVAAEWPAEVIHLRDHFNPKSLRFPTRNPKGCSCRAKCKFTTCANAKVNVFCAPGCCPFNGLCGNGLSMSSKVKLVVDKDTKEYAVVAKEIITKGEMLGEYLGVLTTSTATNSGYKLEMKSRSTKKPTRPVYVDAASHGSILRFVNHSCDPAARFHEMWNGDRTTIVVCTRRTVLPGSEVTVDYGSDLWFVCQCGSPLCRHKNTTPTQPRQM